MPHHFEDGDNIVGRQPSHVKPDSQSGSLCTESDMSFRKCWFWQRRNLVGWCIWWGMRARLF